MGIYESYNFINPARVHCEVMYDEYIQNQQIFFICLINILLIGWSWHIGLTYLGGLHQNMFPPNWWYLFQNIRLIKTRRAFNNCLSIVHWFIAFKLCCSYLTCTAAYRWEFYLYFYSKVASSGIKFESSEYYFNILVVKLQSSFKLYYIVYE